MESLAANHIGRAPPVNTCNFVIFGSGVVGTVAMEIAAPEGRLHRQLRNDPRGTAIPFDGTSLVEATLLKHY